MIMWTQLPPGILGSTLLRVARRFDKNRSGDVFRREQCAPSATHGQAADERAAGRSAAEGKSADTRECQPRNNCQDAVCATYNNLIGHGFSDLDAVESSVRVLRLHHPELSRDQAFIRVDSWLSPEE